MRAAGRLAGSADAGAREPGNADGFTLIEVLVALAIVAIGMAAVLEALTSSANTALYLQSKTFAEWVALNQLETVRLAGTVPATGTSTGDVDYAGRSWKWRQKVTETRLSGMLIPGVRRIDVDVRPSDSKAGDDRGWYASATGFVGSALAPPMSPPPDWSNNPIVGVGPNSSTSQPGRNLPP